MADHSTETTSSITPKRADPLVVTGITASVSAILIKGQLAYVRSQGFRPVLVSSPGREVDDLSTDEEIELIPVPMEREISPINDLCSLWRLIRLFRRIRPRVVNAGTPKAGLLCILAAWICRVPARIYTIRGFRHESASPMLRRFLILIERLVCLLSHKVICISPSVLELGLAERIIPKNKAVVIGAGSSNGIDLARFNPQRFTSKDRANLRHNLGIGEHDLVVGFVGRLIPRKGVTELVEAWHTIHANYPQAKLLLVGPYEMAQGLSHETMSAIENDPTIVTTGFVNDVERYFAIMDIFTLPAYWEGFGNVLIQAAAFGVPIVATDVTGVRDAIKADYNAIVIPPRDSHQLTAALERYLRDSQLREMHGQAGIAWVKENFDEKVVWQGLVNVYQHCLSKQKVA